MAATLEGFGILLILATSNAFPQFRMPFYRPVTPIQDSPVRLMSVSRDGGSAGHRTRPDDYNAIPVTLGGRKYIMMNVDDSEPDSHENVYQPANMNLQSNKFVRYQPQQNVWNRNPETYNHNNNGHKNLLFYKGDDGKLLPVQRNRFTDWLYGLVSRFQKAPVKKEPETSEINIIHPPPAQPPPPEYSYDNPFSSQQNHPYPASAYPYPYPYYPTYQYGHNFNPYSGKPNRFHPPGFVNKDPTLQELEGAAAQSTAEFAPYPPFSGSGAAAQEEPAEEEQDEHEADGRKRTIFVMPESRKSTGGFVW